MAKLIVLSGLPGAGKSTLAEDIVVQMAQAGIGATVIARDEYRQHVEHADEADLSEKMLDSARVALGVGMTVIVDAPNLEQHDRDMWFGLAWDMEVDLVWNQISTPVEVCVERDKDRQYPVGARTIVMMAGSVSKALGVGK